MNLDTIETPDYIEILIVDDTPMNLKLLSDILTAEGFIVRSVVSGKLALQSVKEKLPALILLDVMMPKMDGFEVCRRLKADENTRDIPVIFISALTDEDSKITGFRSGGVDFISKPIHKEEVLARANAQINLFRMQLDLKARNEKLENEIIRRKLAELAVEKRMIALTQPLEDTMDIDFDNLFNIDELQKLQDQFAHAFGVGSVITNTYGTPITKPSNFSRLCQNIIRCTEKGLKNCMNSDAVIGRQNLDGPIVMPCLSGGLWDAGASITVGGKHVANWLIGQVRNEVQEEGKLKEYAKEIGTDEVDFIRAFYEVTPMSLKQFQKISEMLFTMAQQLSDMAYQNIQQSRFINDRKIAEAALLESEERFRTTLYSIGDGVITTDTEGKVRIMNIVAEQLSGWSQTEASGKYLEEVFCIVNEETREPAEIPVRKVLREGVIVGRTNHTLLIAKNGNEHPIAESGAPIRNEKGEIVGVVLVFRDQTVERKAERELKESEEKFRNFFENSPVGKSMTSVDGTMKINKAFCEMLGYSEAELLIKTWEEITHPDDIQKSTDITNLLVQSEAKNIRFEKRYLHKNGDIIWADVSSTLQRDIHSNSMYFITSIHNITDKKKAEQSLRKFKMGIDHSPDAIFITDRNGTIEYINNAFEKIYGYNTSEVIGQTPRIIKSGLYSHPYYERIWNTLLTKHPVAQEIQNKAKNGRLISIEASNNPILDEESEIIGFISINRDITERKIAEEALIDAEEKMAAFFDQSLDGFFFMMLDEPIEWSDLAEKDKLLEYAFSHQRITRINDAMLVQYGATLDQFIGLTPNERFAHDIIHGKNVWRKLFDNGKLHVETDERRLNGEQIIVEGDYNCLYDSKGRITGHFGIQRDITQNKVAIDAIKNERKILRILIDHLPDPIYVKDNRCRKIVANIADLETMGCLNEDDVLGKTDLELFNEEIGQRGYEDDLKVIQYGETIVNREELFFDKNGDERWLLTSKIPLFDQHGKTTGLVGIGRDITEQKKAIQTVQNERQLLRTLIDHLPYPIYVKNKDCRKVLANLADIENICCSTEAEVLGKNDLEIFDYDIGYRGYEDDLQVIQNGKAIINREEVFVDKNGFQRWLITSKIPLFDQHGKTTGLVGIGRDITDQKKSSETIQKLSKSIEQSPSTIIITDIDGNIEYVNPKFTDINGYTAEEVTGKNPRILKSGEMTAEFYKDLWKTITSGEVWRGEFLNRKKNGELYWEWATMTSIKNEKGVITNYIAIKEDISARKQMEADLIIAKEKAEENDRLKSTFLANMSHEIRTPLNSIIGFSELLADPDFESDQRYEFASIITTSGNNLLDIISDIMDISKIEAGQVEIRRSVFPAQKIIQEVHKEYKFKAIDKGIKLNIDLAIPIQDYLIESDQTKLKQVLINFVSNAIKFTEKGTIEIGMRVDADAVRFYVKDTGIGISEEYHGQIFERFRQVEESSTRKYGGNGLGLAISKSLIEMLGGTIGMESGSGEGSIFYFAIPKIMINE